MEKQGPIAFGEQERKERDRLEARILRRDRLDQRSGERHYLQGRDLRRIWRGRLFLIDRHDQPGWKELKPREAFGRYCQERYDFQFGQAHLLMSGSRRMSREQVRGKALSVGAFYQCSRGATEGIRDALTDLADERQQNVPVRIVETACAAANRTYKKTQDEDRAIAALEKAAEKAQDGAARRRKGKKGEENPGRSGVRGPTTSRGLVAAVMKLLQALLVLCQGGRKHAQAGQRPSEGDAEKVTGVIGKLVAQISLWLDIDLLGELSEKQGEAGQDVDKFGRPNFRPKSAPDGDLGVQNGSKSCARCGTAAGSDGEDGTKVAEGKVAGASTPPPEPAPPAPPEPAPPEPALTAEQAEPAPPPEPALTAEQAEDLRWLSFNPALQALVRYRPPMQEDDTQGDLAGYYFLSAAQYTRDCLAWMMGRWDIKPDMAWQSQRMVRNMANRLYREMSQPIGVFWEGSDLADQEDADAAAAEQEIKDLRAEADAHTVTLGSATRTDQEVDIAMASAQGDDSRIALSFKTPQVIVFLGKPKTGKSFAGKLILTGVTQKGPGRLARPLAGCYFWADWQTGTLYPELLATLRRNTDEGQIGYVRRWFGMDIRDIPDAEMRRVRLVTPLANLKNAKVQYEPLIREFDLPVQPLRFRVEKMTSQEWDVLLKMDSATDPAYVSFVHRLLEHEGNGLTLPAMKRAIKRARSLRRDIKNGLLMKLEQLRDLLSDEEGVEETVDRGYLTIFDQKGTWMGPGEIIRINMAAINLILRYGDFQKLFAVDEMNKYNLTLSLLKFLMALIREVRHRKSSFMLSGQSVDEIPTGMVPMASVLGVFQMLSEEEYRKLQRMFAVFADIPYARIRELVCGQAFLAATESSQPGWTQSAHGVWFRPLHAEDGGDSEEG